MPSGPEVEIVVWVLIAILSGIGEILTGSFFLLPFAIGAIVAAIAAGFGVGLPWVLGLFLAVSISSLLWLRRFAKQSEAEAPAIRAGAGRYVDAVGRVSGDIDGASEGRVELSGQAWRALSADGEPIPAGTEVRVVEVRGTALIVEAL